ncbi:hypothetical protein [Streptomyces collinus]
MASELSGTAGLGDRDDHGWASFRPPADPDAIELLIDQIVLAVRVGDDPAIRRLLARLAGMADVAVLLRLRQRLYEDVPG